MNEAQADIREELERLNSEVRVLKSSLEVLEAKVEDKIERLEKENQALRQGGRRVGALTMKVSEKGALSVYGLGRFPVTLYREQWERLLGAADDIRSFIAENASSLRSKEQAGD